MKVLVIISLCLIMSITAMPSKNKFDYTNKRSVMAVMVEVEARLKTKAPLDSILNVLTDFRDAVNIEQVDHDEIYGVQQAECASESEFRTKQVTDARNVLRDSSAALTNCQNQKNRTQNQFEVNEQQTFHNEEYLKMILHARETEQTYFKKRSQDYEDALHNIEEASDILAALYSGTGAFSLIEVGRVSRKMLEHAINIKATTHYAPVLGAFASLAHKERQFDESALERVAQLLESLRENIQKAYSLFATSNAEAISNYNEQNERLTQTLERLNHQSERLQDKLDHYTQCVGTQSAIAQAASGKLQRNSQLQEQAQALCATFDNEYNFATSSRRSELSLVAELEDMVKRRFAQVEDESHERRQRLSE